MVNSSMILILWIGGKWATHESVKEQVKQKERVVKNAAQSRITDDEVLKTV